MQKVFISYVREDQTTVDLLAQELRSAGIDVWLDRENILPGEFWDDAIRHAIRRGDYFIACFSNSYNRRKRTYMNEELTLAIEELRLRPANTRWFIPVLFSGSMPDREIWAGKTLRSLQYVELTTLNWNDGIRRILSAIGGVKSISSTITPYNNKLTMPSDKKTVTVTVLKCRDMENVFPVGSQWEKGPFINPVTFWREKYGYSTALDIWEREVISGALCADQLGQMYFLYPMQLHPPDGVSKRYDYDTFPGRPVLLGPFKSEYRLISPDLRSEYHAINVLTGRSYHLVTYHV